MKKIYVLLLFILTQNFLFASDLTFKDYYKKEYRIDYTGSVIFFKDLIKKNPKMFKDAWYMIKRNIVKYSLHKAITTYEYKNLIKKSQELTTLPMPTNKDGTYTFEKAMEIIEIINKQSNSNKKEIIKIALDFMNRPTLQEYNKAKEIINNTSFYKILATSEADNAINIVNRYEEEENLDDDEKSKKRGLQALLSFIINDYKNAKEYAHKSIMLAQKNNIKYSLPSFIYATSIIYDKQVNLDKTSTSYIFFKYSILNEIDNGFIPLLFKIYLDRLELRFDSNLDANYLNLIYNVGKDNRLKSIIKIYFL